MRDRYRKALEAGRPDRGTVFDYYERTAGTGSLGRPRYFGVGAWRAIWSCARRRRWFPPAGRWRMAARAGCAAPRSRPAGIASPDPYLSCCVGSVLVRRLSPNDFKIEAEPKGGKAKDKDKKEETHKLVDRKRW